MGVGSEKLGWGGGVGVWVGGVKGRKSWDWGVGSEEVEVGEILLGGGVRKVGVEGVEVGGLGSGVLGLVKLGSSRLKSGRWRRRGWGRGS